MKPWDTGPDHMPGWLTATTLSAHGVLVGKKPRGSSEKIEGLRTRGSASSSSWAMNIDVGGIDPLPPSP